jgi:Lon-like ATP-dependent protease
LESIGISNDQISISENAETELNFDREIFGITSKKQSDLMSQDDELQSVYKNKVTGPFSDLENVCFYVSSSKNTFNVTETDDVLINKELVREYNDNKQLVVKEELNVIKSIQNLEEKGSRLVEYYTSKISKSHVGYNDLMEFYSSNNFFTTMQIFKQIKKKMVNISKSMKSLEVLVESSMFVKRNREKFQESYKILQQMFESQSSKDKLLLKYINNLKNKTIPPETYNIIKENMEKFASIDKNSSEFQVIKSYLDIATTFPFGITSEETFDLDKAKQILEEEHFGMKEIKNKILEFFATGKLKNSIEGKILCLHGPPGVGKTSFAFSVAKALSRNVHRISLGGERDPNSLKGHRRTYLASKCGKFIKGMIDTGTENCVMILDEVDKLGEGFNGNPKMVLLEVLDPEQNKAFTDNYLDFPVDLSKVLFICTANNLKTIPEPLLDRMDLIELTSYTSDEKKKIFERYILPEIKQETGLLTYEDQFDITNEAVHEIIENYSRESGVRLLKQNTNKIMEKIAYKILEGRENDDQKKIVVDKGNLQEFLGLPVYSKKSMYSGIPYIRSY